MRDCINMINLKECELLPLEAERLIASHEELVCFVVCYKLCERGGRSQKKESLNLGEPRTVEKGDLQKEDVMVWALSCRKTERQCIKPSQYPGIGESVKKL